MAESMKVLSSKCRKVPSIQRKYWEWELSFGTHTGKFVPGILPEYFATLKAHYKLTDDKAKYYVDHRQDNVRQRIETNADPNSSGGKLTTKPPEVVEKRKIAHIDYTVLQRNNIGLRSWLRDEIPLQPGDHGYPKIIPKEGGQTRKQWSFDAPLYPNLFRIDMAEISEFAKPDTNQVEIEVKNIEVAMTMDEKQFIESFMHVGSELLNIIANNHPKKIKYFFVPTSMLQKRKTPSLLAHNSKLAAHSSPPNHGMGVTGVLASSLLTPSTIPLTTVPDVKTVQESLAYKKRKLADSTVEELPSAAVDLYTPTPTTHSPDPSSSSSVPVTTVSLATILASPSPLTHDGKEIDSVSTPTSNPKIQVLIAGLSSSSSSTKALKNITDIKPEQCYTAKAVDLMFVSHTPGCFVQDDPEYKFV